MTRYQNTSLSFALFVLMMFNLLGCKSELSEPEAKSLPDLSAQIRPYMTVENTKLRTGPGNEFRAIGEIKRDARIHVVGRDGDWALIVSRKGNPPGYVELSSIEPGGREASESHVPLVEGRYESLVDTHVRSGPGLHYPVVAEIKKGTRINVVDEEKGWLKVESKRGNKTGYVDASLTRALAHQ